MAAGQSPKTCVSSTRLNPTSLSSSFPGLSAGRRLEQRRLSTDMMAKLTLVVSLTTLWLALVRVLSSQWTVYEQYKYGWAVPFLCVYFAWNRRGQARYQNADPSRISSIGLGLLCFVAFLWLPLRILQEANPIWRASSYGLALTACALTLLMIRFSARNPFPLVFPILFFLVAVPWPSAIENGLIDQFTKWNTATSVELLGALGFPVLQHGNVIETARGPVGVDEACSGIRSFQASFMVALALGEIQRLNTWNRVGLIFAGWGLAFVFNGARTTLLTWIAATKGPGAIAGWHDPAGVSILLACFVSLWIVAVCLKRRERVPERAESGETEFPNLSLPGSAESPRRVRGSARWLGVALFAWILVSEGVTEVWFRTQERRGELDNGWSIEKPADDRYRDVEQTQFVLDWLACDEHVSIGWNSDDGHPWRLFYFRWLPAKSLSRRTLIALSRTHRPDHCLPATGKTLVREEPPQVVTASGATFAFRTYRFDDGGTPLFVFHCLAEDGAPGDEVSNLRETTMARLRAGWMGRRGSGQRSLQLAVWGYKELELARNALFKELGPLVRWPGAPLGRRSVPDIAASAAP